MFKRFIFILISKLKSYDRFGLGFMLFSYFVGISYVYAVIRRGYLGTDIGAWLFITCLTIMGIGILVDIMDYIVEIEEESELGTRQIFPNEDIQISIYMQQGFNDDLVEVTDSLVRDNPLPKQVTINVSKNDVVVSKVFNLSHKDVIRKSSFESLQKVEIYKKKVHKISFYKDEVSYRSYVRLIYAPLESDVRVDVENQLHDLLNYKIEVD